MELFELEEILKGHLVQFKDWYLWDLVMKLFTYKDTPGIPHARYSRQRGFQRYAFFLDANTNQFLFTSQIKLSETVWW